MNKIERALKLGEYTLTRDAVSEYPNKPGINQSIIKVYVDSDWPSIREIIILEDKKTMIYFYKNTLPEKISENEYLYLAKLITNNSKDFVNPKLLKKNCIIKRLPE